MLLVLSIFPLIVETDENQKYIPGPLNITGLWKTIPNKFSVSGVFPKWLKSKRRRTKKKKRERETESW